MQFRLINSRKSTPAMNMAIDEALLHSKMPVLRFYQWQPPGLSVGFFQNVKDEINLEQCKKSGVDIKGLTTREFAKIPILGQPVELRPLISDHYFLIRS